MFHVEQDLTMEIVLLLIDSDSHPRRISKELGVPHTTIIRKLRNLSDANAIDFREEGKNKVYFLEDTLEARTCIISAEVYRFARTLDSYPRLRAVFNSVIRDDRIRLAILFGSYARGAPTFRSDIDVFVETEDRQVKLDLEKIQSRVSVKIGPFDRSKDLVKEIEKNHVIIKGFEDYVSKTRILQ